MQHKIQYALSPAPAVYFDIETLLFHLQGDDIILRRHARELLGRIGHRVVPSLIQLLSHRNEHVRWEACKTLGRICDPIAGEHLAEAMLDESMDVRWVAAEALISLEQHAVEPLLIILEQHFDSVFAREGAHHVLHSLHHEYLFDEDIDIVYHALNINISTPRLAFAAMAALDHLRTRRISPLKKKEKQIFH